MMGRDGREPYDGHNRRPQKTPMRALGARRARRRVVASLRIWLGAKRRSR